MTQADQARAFQADISKLIDRYRSEFELALATAIGVLEVVKLELWMEEYDRLNDCEEDDE